MRKLKLALIASSLLVFTIAFLVKDDIEDFYTQLASNLKTLDQTRDFTLKEVKREIFTPPPLIAKEESETSNLTVSGTIQWTNAQRRENDVAELKMNTKLNASAQVKVNDMFKNQYFAHDSPSGKSAGDLAHEAGYDYVLIGENLALGNFADDQTLVQAWMDSPGHRANILKEDFTEIGVAVGRGIYEGKMTWLAVQHFGKPMPNCPSPDNSLKNQIEANQAKLNQWKGELDAKKQDMDNTNPKNGPEYEAKVNSYNSQVELYNSLLTSTRQMVDSYNSQVNNFNNCVGS
ncbi:MAG: CAP domain-containing protein [Candidatus Curtissbacteria bacterium]|nr:CAP domain-containing protein [Candidatus Curtissbacteria bacterium]